MITLDPEILLTDEFYEDEFESTGNKARGLYSPMQFVLRLRDDIHLELRDETNTQPTPKKIQAFSTFLHENIHWWQHVGSNLGFITSLSYPAFAHCTAGDLKRLLEKNIKYKSLLKLDALNYKANKLNDHPEVTRILNYFFDLRYAKQFILDNETIDEIGKDRRFFLSMGHCFHMLWTTSINVLAQVVDPKYSFIPDVTKWTENFERMKSEKVQGFCIDSGVTISSLGTKAIFEGQARFNQLQYLNIGLDDTLKYADFEKAGMLNGIYVQAFDRFLELTTINRPPDFNNSIVGLFLLLCDIAINPSDGFPIDVNYFHTFIYSNDPGLRFEMLCMHIKKNPSKWINAVKEYSKKEYIELSEELCEAIVCVPPYYASGVVYSWIQEQEEIKKLLEEEKVMKYEPERLAIRLFFSKYIRFQEDKFEYPNVFCWIGKSMTGEVSKEIDLQTVEILFNKHKALFIDDIDGEIKPTLFEGYNQEDIESTFNSFYTFNTLYDMILKWTIESGDFKYDYKWLTVKNSSADVKNWVRSNFKDAFGIYPEELTILT